MTRILVIDDDAVLRDAILETLGHYRFEVAGAHNGTAGLEMIRQYKPNLVLCDIHMNDIDGFSVLQQITHDGLITSVPFIFMTAHSDRNIQHRAMSLGADDYLVKPFSGEQLVDRVEARLQKYKQIEDRHTHTITALKHNISYSLPHELRTPLGAILGYGTLLRETSQDPIPEEVEEFASRILSSAKRLQHVVENYIVFMQLETMGEERRKGLRRNILPDVSPIVRDAARTVAENYGRAEDLAMDVSSVALCITDQDLRKIIQELVDNAFKFSSEGSSVVMQAKREADCYRVEIVDQGRGMTSEQLNSVGEFMQFDRKHHEQRGLGLGLTLARRLVEVYEGKFNITSDVDKGTLVELIFPL